MPNETKTNSIMPCCRQSHCIHLALEEYNFLRLNYSCHTLNICISRQRRKNSSTCCQYQKGNLIPSFLFVFYPISCIRMVFIICCFFLLRGYRFAPLSLVRCIFLVWQCSSWWRWLLVRCIGGESDADRCLFWLLLDFVHDLPRLRANADGGCVWCRDRAPSLLFWLQSIHYTTKYPPFG